ncbi:4a-hydroxytetrahydrobiopterin dehydratase [Candidatus Nomurabacteria bacterium CG10_big_fil_rev_8_21_14_0_10_35_16]|uniref:Putative pterin-4-alpha-carbinolamine dehydratase n=1 Tax=Candidatus Nomurabacteria bacterium CG10_big_fil_rev_8_21_14_0_10_35_16 TaxID=1974731 RepID=A0A2H0TC82_9BACT|nr:MAG: 4a-hydroxytetrahydrobiopterin dehydratase [Candidatus Nomurabacteria bacterium CG10_big_fil_rev_8_21_14_0_10_35_16]
MNDLLKKKCVPCEGGMEPLKQEEVFGLMEQIDGWNVDGDFKVIFKEFKFKDFIGATNFVNQIAEIAEEEGHHPDIHIFYNKVVLELTTHAIKGLSENDFILAAKIDAHN